MQLAVCKVLIITAMLKLSVASNFFKADEFPESVHINGTTIVRILQRVDFLSVHLRHKYDFANTYVQFLLRQKTRPVQLTVGDIQVGSFDQKLRHRALALAGAAELEDIVATVATRAGILICVLMSVVSDDILRNIAHTLWVQRGIFKVYYMQTGRMLFFNPFALQTGAVYGTMVDANEQALEECFANLNAYPLRTYIFDSTYSSVFGDVSTKHITHATGADSEVAKLLSKNMNFTLSLQWPDKDFFGTHLENGSFNGALGRIIRDDTDIALTGFFVKDYLTRDVEFSVSVYMDKLCCYVMKAKRIPQSVVPLFAVENDMWLGFLLAGIFCACVWIGLRRLNMCLKTKPMPNATTRSVSDFQYVRIFIDTWVVWVRVNIVKFPPFHSERVFVISLCLVSVIFGALFESSLATVYIRPLYYKDINTLQALDSANLMIYIKHAAMKDDLFAGHSSSIYENLDKKLLLVGEPEERLIEIMSKRGGFAAVTRSSALELDDIRYFITKKIHQITECPKNYHIAFLMQKHSPYEKRINVLLLSFSQAGLIDHWISQTKHKAKLSIYQYPSYLREQGYIWKVLTLNDLQLAFYALAAGCLIAAIMYAVETALQTCSFLRICKKI